MEIKLKSKIIVQSIIKMCDIKTIPAYVRQSGFEDAGAIVVKSAISFSEAILYSYSGGLWRKILGEKAIDNMRAEEYLAKEMDFDPDLWVLEIEDSKCEFPFEGV